MLAIILAVLSMAAKDALGTLMVVAESRGRGSLAGAMDAGGDLANVICTIVGAGAVIQGGITVHTCIVLAAMMITSYLGTTYWTNFAARHVKALPVEVAAK